jgi:tetratricopeptide (TPR) repeat protein
MSRRLGLIIGINQYQDPTFRPSQYAENDTRALAQWLVNNQGGKWSPAHVQLTQGQAATRELVESLLTQVCLNMPEPGDLVLIYFAGQAFIDERSGDGYLALANTNYHMPSTGLYLSSLIQQLMPQSRAAHILLILDCMQTGPIWSRARTTPYDVKPLLGPANFNALQQQANRLILCSCRGNDQAPETGERSLGLFANRMIVGLCGPAIDQATGSVSLQQLHSYLSAVLGEQQRPHLFGQLRSPAILVGEMPSASSALHPYNLQQSAFSPGMPPVPTSSLNPQPYATATMQPPSAAPYMQDAAQVNTTIEQHRQQQVAQLTSQAQQFIKMQNYPEALNILERTIQIAPNYTPALILKGQLLGTVGRFPEALAAVEQLVQFDPNNPLAWSMRAVLLSNMGEYPEALKAIERALELNPTDPETHTIRTNIMENLAVAQSRESGQRPAFSAKKENKAASFLLGIVLQIVGLIMGAAGIALPIVQPRLSVMIGFAAASLGLALLCINAARGAHKHGFLQLFFTILLSAVPVGVLGAAYKLFFTRITGFVVAQPSRIVPVLFIVVWLAAAAILPLPLAIGGVISGLVSRARKKKR